VKGDRSGGDIVIDARGVSKVYVLRHNRSMALKTRFLSWFHEAHRESAEEFAALTDVSLSIRHGDTLGIVGRNGCGKSTLLKMIAGLVRPTSGQLLVDRHARIGTMIELGIGFHPELTGQENVRLSSSIYGFSREQIDTFYPRVVAYSRLEHFMDVPIKNYSSGMRMRLGFAIAVHLEADVLLLDEIFAVGDAEFQEQCAETLHDLRAQGRTILFVSHATPAIRKVCSRVCVLDHGRLIFDGDVDEGLATYERLTGVSDSPLVPAVP
jgi:ABC-type polysaccharide/polyol phosphate transport system ATPase subunit